MFHFEHFNFLSDDDKYYLFAGGAFKCSFYAYEYLDSLDIVINTNHEVIDNNADEVVDGKYVWHIKKDVNDYELKFITSKKSVVVKKKIDIKLLMYIGFSSAVFLLLLILGIIIKHKRVNKI